MEEKCLCEPNEILIFSCAGSSNVGQIANQAAIKLAQSGVGRYFCLAGIGGHVSGMIESTRAGKLIVAIDGCPVACATKTLEHAGFQVGEHVQASELLGIEKNHELSLDPAAAGTVSDCVTSLVSKRRGVQ